MWALPRAVSYTHLDVYKRQEKKEFFVHAVLRVALPIVAMVALFMVLFIPGLMLVGSLAAVELGIHSAFADATGGGRQWAFCCRDFLVRWHLGLDFWPASAWAAQ